MTLQIEKQLVRTTLRRERLPMTVATQLCYTPDDQRFLAVSSEDDIAKSIAPVQSRAFHGINVDEPPRHQPLSLAGTTLLFLEDTTTRGMLPHYYHLLEHLLAAWPVLADRREHVRRVVLASDGRFLLKWRGANRLNEKLVGALFPNADLLAWRSFRQLGGGSVKRLRNRLAREPPWFYVMEDAVLVDRALTHGDATCRHINKMLAHYRDQFSVALWLRMANAVLDGMGIKRRPSEDLRVTYVLRTKRRRLSDECRAALRTAVKAIKGVRFRAVDFALMPYQEQLDTAANTDVLIGVHGNGLSNGFFLPANATLVEIFPRDGHALDYRMLAEFRGLSYLGIHSELGVIDEATAWRIGGYGRLKRNVEEIDVAPIVEMIERRAEQRD